MKPTSEWGAEEWEEWGKTLEASKMKLKNRQRRLARFLELNAPQTLIDRERELIADAEKEIEERSKDATKAQDR